ncbi:peptidase, partial [Mesorhizobium sp. M7A.F.Ca.US.003.02.2.1]
MSFFREPRDGAASLAPNGPQMAWRRLLRAPFTEFPRNWRVIMTARYGSRLAAIGATALLTAAVFVLPAKAETDVK